MKFSQYSLLVKVDKGLVIYNSKNAKYVNIFKEPELSSLKKIIEEEYLPPDSPIVHALYENGYIVDDDCDEYSEIKKKIDDHYAKTKNSLRIMLYVTENCNFRCIYCPQKHDAKNLSDKKWDSLYKYLEKKISTNSYKKIQISFFGGEPLLKSKQIIKFLNIMKELNNTYPSVKILYTMTTNGYLLSPRLYDKLVKLGLVSFQITVDGFAEAHNKMRMLADGSPTWDTVIRNLKYINSKNDNVHICLRTNCNSINRNSIDNFYEWLVKTFDNKKIDFDIEPVERFSKNVKEEYLAEENKTELDTIIQKHERFTISPKNFLVPLGQVCSCAENYLIISADGIITKCEQAYEDVTAPVGFLSDDGEIILSDNYKKWTEDFETEKCPKCFLYPLCAGRKCMRKKANYPDERPDCDANYVDVIDEVIQMIRSGSLDKNHVSKD